MVDSEKLSEQVQQETSSQSSQNQQKATQAPKQVIATKVTGKVKWFNVKSGYGFINRIDTKEDVFVHQTAIIKNNPKKAVRSVGDGEIVEFDVVIGEKGNEAANVTGPSGEPVRGSQFAADKRRRFRPLLYRNRRRTGGSVGGGGGGGNRQDSLGQNIEGSGGDGGQSDGQGQQQQQRPQQRRYRARGRGRFNFYSRRQRRDPQNVSNGDVNLQNAETSGDDNAGSGVRSGGQFRSRGGQSRHYFRRNYRGGRSGGATRRPRSPDGNPQEGGAGGQRKQRRNPRFRNNRRKNTSNTSGGAQSGNENDQPQTQTSDAGQAVQNTTTESTA